MKNMPVENARMMAEINDALESRFGGVQAAMARAAGMSLPRLNRILRGKLPLSSRAHAKLLEATDQNCSSETSNPEVDSAKSGLYAQRRDRLREVVDSRFGGVNKRFAEAIDLAQPQVSGIISGSRNIGERLARRLERLLDLPPGHLDGVRVIADLDQSSRQALRRERLKEAIDQVFGGSVAAFSRHMDLAEPYVHSMMTGTKGIGEGSARLIEKRLLLETGTFDRLEEISFPVRSMSAHSGGVEIKLALLLSYLKDRPADSKTCAMLNATADVAIERLLRQTQGDIS